MDEKSLLIGGSYDGKRVSCNIKVIELPVIKDFPLRPSIEPVEETICIKERYVLHAIAGERKDFRIYCLEKLDVDEMLDKLISGYRQE